MVYNNKLKGITFLPLLTAILYLDKIKVGGKT